MECKLKLIFVTVFFLSIPFISVAAQTTQIFNIEKSYDLYGREQIEAILLQSAHQLSFYVDKTWWEKKNLEQQNKITAILSELGDEFSSRIYPILTNTFGPEPSVGIDGDKKITILIHEMIEGSAGYFDPGNGYDRLQNPRSNQRKMLYLSAQQIEKPLVKTFLAHEFVHLITFNQKEIQRGVTEDVWLNEARAEYAPTLLGYDEVYRESNLERRVRDFLSNPNDSLIEWLNKKADYGILNLFTQYLVDHYGIRILQDSLWSSQTGLASLNYALSRNNIKKNLAQIFTDWSVAVLVNDCSLGDIYCYKNKNLKDFRLLPESSYLPTSGPTVMNVYGEVKDWSVKWQRLFGGKGDLMLEFNGAAEMGSTVPYLLCDFQDKCSIDFLELNQEKKAKIIIPNFSQQYFSLILIPSVQFANSTEKAPFYHFSYSIKTGEGLKNNEELIVQLREQILALQAEINRLQKMLNEILANQNKPIVCSQLANDLYFGIRNSLEVKCLQEFLKNQGPEIYPEGLITGNFLNLTYQAVIRFQEKYADEILKPLGLDKGTGYVGPATRNKINQLLKF